MRDMDTFEVLNVCSEVMEPIDDLHHRWGRRLQHNVANMPLIMRPKSRNIVHIYFGPPGRISEAVSSLGTNGHAIGHAIRPVPSGLSIGYLVRKCPARIAGRIDSPH